MSSLQPYTLFQVYHSSMICLFFMNAICATGFFGINAMKVALKLFTKVWLVWKKLAVSMMSFKVSQKVLKKTIGKPSGPGASP